ncbi:WD40 repeat-like protein [Martensiomyces pterosporus]|nr:WD40 repeat-like protein [Martensiomyces pterosporus]
MNDVIFGESLLSRAREGNCDQCGEQEGSREERHPGVLFYAVSHEDAKSCLGFSPLACAVCLPCRHQGLGLAFSGWPGVIVHHKSFACWALVWCLLLLVRQPLASPVSKAPPLFISTNSVFSTTKEMSSGSSKQYELTQPPSDGVSRVKFHPADDSKLLVSSWDQRVRLYDVQANQLVASHHSHQAAVLDIEFGTTSSYSGGLDRRLLAWEDNYTTTTELGRHDGPISALEFSRPHNVLLSGSWDRTLRAWDPRAGSEGRAEVQKVGVEERVYSMSADGDLLVVALAGRKFLIYDVRNLDAPIETRDSSLKYPTRCVKLMPSGQGFVCGSVEGRVAVEYLKGVEGKSNYAFKCHRQTADDGVDLVYPVNAVAFHPVHQTFVTGGSDAMVSLWDPDNKKRLKQYHKYPASVASLDFNASGNTLAVAASYTYDEGEKDHPPDSIWIKSVSESETKPKAKKA